MDMKHPERAADDASDPKSPLFPKMHVNDKDQAGGWGGGPKPPPRNKMAIYEHQPAAAGSMTTSSQRINTSTNTALPATMPPPPPLLPPPKFSGISPSGSSLCYVGGQVPPSAAVRLPFYGQNTAPINTPPLPTLPLLPFSKLDDGQAASISQQKKPPQVSSTRNVQKNYPELEIFQQNHFRNDTYGSKQRVTDDSLESLYAQRYATRADVLTTSSSTTNWQPKQSNHSIIAFGSGSTTKPANNSVEQVSASELIRRESCLPKATPVDDIRGTVRVATSSNTPHTHCEYRGVPELQHVSNRKGSRLEITPAESTSTVISPEEVTALIGEDAFLRLRGEMIKHQKQFVEQVFELHRLISVQRLIARSRRAFLEDKYKKLEKPSSSRTKNPKETHKGNNVERQEDNLRLKSSSGYVSDIFYLPPQRNDPFKVPPITPRPNQETSAGNSKPTITSGISSPWIYPPPGSANHWLVPVMSPSEGLIYKPYPIPSAPTPAGFIAPPIQVNPPKPAQTHPPPFQQSGIRPLADIPFSLPQYVAPSLAPASAFEHVGKADSYHHPNAAVPGSSFKSSWNFSNLGSGTVSCQVDATNQAKHGGDSTASSSPPDRTQGNILPLFPEEPTAIAMLNKPQHRNHQQGQGSEQPQRKVIKAVPHPPTSATESTARIIRSIWEERN